MMGLLLDGAVTILSAAIVQWFTWALNNHFQSDETPTGTKVILAASVTTGLGLLVLLWIGSQPPAAQLIGMAIEICSAGLFAATLAATRETRFRLAFDDELPDQLVRSGPYKYIRHPFYTSYLIYWSGFALATFSWLALPLLLLIGSIYTFAARGEDRQFAMSDLAEQHAQYRQHAGMFWPRLWRR